MSSTKPVIMVNYQPLAELPTDLYIPPEALQVFLELFEGPLDLLLYLIRKQNLDILQIPIAKITNQYITYINAMQVLNIELASEYLLMAAVLLEIKSRILLPRAPQEDPNEGEGQDPRLELIQRLIEYEKMKLASQNLNALPQAYRDYLWIDVMIEEPEQELPQIVAKDLHKAWHTLLLRSLQARTEHHIKKQELSLREHMSQILKLLQTIQRANFYALFQVKLGAAHLIVNFMAILELAKEGLIGISQDDEQCIIIELVG